MCVCTGRGPSFWPRSDVSGPGRQMWPHPPKYSWDAAHRSRPQTRRGPAEPSGLAKQRRHPECTPGRGGRAGRGSDGRAGGHGGGPRVVGRRPDGGRESAGATGWSKNLAREHTTGGLSPVQAPPPARARCPGNAWPSTLKKYARPFSPTSQPRAKPLTHSPSPIPRPGSRCSRELVRKCGVPNFGTPNPRATQHFLN